MAQQYHNRWQAVAEFEVAEQRQTSASQRWHKLNSIVGMAIALGLKPENEAAQDRIVYQRWNKLRQFYLVEVEGKRP
ncbi:MAG: hypothetical protein GY803_21370 [Chloroflexi bacterium]|nr:hypothetical protein [Chloroflexota bacterium]